MKTTNLTFLIYFGILFMSILAIVYFSKERLNNKENKIYKVMLITNIIGLILQLICEFVSYNYYKLPSIISNIMYKLYLVQFMIFALFLLYYLLTIAYENKRIKKAVIITLCAVCVCVFVLPINAYIDIENNIYYTFGAVVSFVYAITFLVSVSILIILLLKRKKISLKKQYHYIYLF